MKVPSGTERVPVPTFPVSRLTRSHGQSGIPFQPIVGDIDAPFAKCEGKMAIDSREFIAMAKRDAVDDTVQECVNQLTAPRVQKTSPEPSDPLQGSISRWLEDRAKVER